MAQSSPPIKLAHDDNLAIYTRSDTTLVLSATSFALTQSKLDGLKTSRLLIYANIVLLGGKINYPGNELQIHCNELKWEDGTLLDVSGKAGENIAAIGPQPAANGQDGGSISLHIHNLPLAESTKGPTYWPKALKCAAKGGAPGNYHTGDTKWAPGETGKPGSVTVYYSNKDYRAYAGLYDIYSNPSNHVDRLRTIWKHAIPKLKDTHPAFYSLSKEKVATLEKLSRDLLDFHVALTKSSELLRALNFPESAQPAIRSLQGLVKKLRSLPDYSMIPKAGLEQTQELFQALMALKEISDIKSSNEKAVQAVEKVIGLVEGLNENLTQPVADIPLKKIDTPLKNLVEAIVDEFTMTEKKFQDQGKDKEHPFNTKPVTYSVSGGDDLAVPIPLVHPGQCQMEMRRADAAFFAEDIDTATIAYGNLRERLAFVPHLMSNQLEVKQGHSKAEPLLLAFVQLEAVDRLSHWTFDSLSTLFAQVNSRLEQLSMGYDLFGLTRDWVPRLSVQFYTDRAEQQIKRLKNFEQSYWEYFDEYQNQMEGGRVLKEGLAANVYRRKEARDTLDALFRSMREKEDAIQASATDIQTKREELEKAIDQAKGILQKLQMPSAASVLTALGSCVITGIALASNPVGWIAGIGLAAAALTPQGFALWDEASNSIEDAHGQKVNKSLLLNRLTTCKDDLHSLLNQPAYSMQADGVKTLDEGQASKILVTAEQLESFLKQFEGAIGGKDSKVGDTAVSRRLSKAVREFTKATNARNQDILAYNNAVLQSYEKIKQQALLESQAGDISSQLIKENIGLPSIVAYYQRFRDLSRVSILNTIKHGALALRFWGLIEPVKFNVTLLSNVDELEAHVDILVTEHSTILSSLGSLAQSSWPSSDSPDSTGILYRLQDSQLEALKLGFNDPWATTKQSSEPIPQVHSVLVDTLASPATPHSSIDDTPFAGMANVRLSQVRVWIPGLRSRVSPSLRLSLLIEIKHEGMESLVNSKGVVSQFRHSAIYLSFQYNSTAVQTVADIRNRNVSSTHTLGSDWIGTNSNARTQAPIGPFANWVITIREKDNGPLDWTDVKEAFMEFHGSGFPFQR